MHTGGKEVMAGFAWPSGALALVPFDVICPTEPDFWTLPLEQVMILSRGTSFSAEDQHDIDTHALYRLWV